MKKVFIFTVSEFVSKFRYCVWGFGGFYENPQGVTVSQMSSGHLANARGAKPVWKITALAVIFIGIILFFISQIYAQTQNRIFIKDIVPSEGVSKDVVKKIRDIITVTVFEKYGNKYKVLNDDDIKIMFEKAETLLATGCDAEQCMIQIGFSIDADEIIYGTVTVRMGKLHIVMNNLKRDRDKEEFFKKSIVDVEFYKSQLGWYAKEIAKKLIEPKYFIDSSKAPTEMKIELELSKIKLKEIKGLDISPFEFKTEDTTIGRIVDYAKEQIKEGDSYFKDKEYNSAIEKYNEVIEAIETKLPAGKQQKLVRFKNSVIERVVASYKMYFKGKIEEADEKAKRNQFTEALSGYEQIVEEIKSVKYRSQLSDIQNLLWTRIDALYVYQAQYSEKEADTYYSEYKFEQAKEKYWEALRYLDKLNTVTEESRNYKQKLQIKLNVTDTTGFSYFKNTVFSYCDWIDYYNFSKQENKARETLNKLDEHIFRSSWCNRKEIIEEYNQRAELLKEEKISVCEEGNRIIGGIEFVSIPAGEFMMGSENGYNDEKPVHKVKVSGFWMGKYEITVGQFKDFIEASGYQTDADKAGWSYIWNGSEWEGKYGVNWKCGISGEQNMNERKNHPVIHISWIDAKAYCKWFSKKHAIKCRLPTEAEWEYACRAGTTTEYYWGNSMDGSYCWYSDNSGNTTHPVGRRKPNKWGLYDMSGNVWEWCEDWYDESYYRNSSAKDPTGPGSGGYKVLRGGSWSHGGGNCRSGNRYSNDPDLRDWDGSRGFRVVVSK